MVLLILHAIVQRAPLYYPPHHHHQEPVVLPANTGFSVGTYAKEFFILANYRNLREIRLTYTRTYSYSRASRVPSNRGKIRRQHLSDICVLSLRIYNDNTVSYTHLTLPTIYSV